MGNTRAKDTPEIQEVTEESNPEVWAALQPPEEVEVFVPPPAPTLRLKLVDLVGHLGQLAENNRVFALQVADNGRKRECLGEAQGLQLAKSMLLDVLMCGPLYGTQ